MKAVFKVVSEYLGVSDSEKPLVSIIVPVYNGERYLRASLDSIVGQTYSPLEILIMDDGSTDATPEIVAGYGNKVKYSRQLQNKGQFPNVNDGIPKALGKYIAVYHADDLYDSEIVAREVDFLEKNPNVAAVFCHDIFINAEGREYGRLSIPSELQALPYLDFTAVLNGVLKYKNRFLPTPGAMVRAAVYRELGTFRGAEFQIAADFEMWLRIARRYPIGILPQYLFSYRHGHENSSQVYYRVRTEPERHFLILDQYLAEGARRFATDESIRHYEAHRAEDNLMVAINHYILGKNQEGKDFLNKVRISVLLTSSAVERGRLLILFLALQVLLRVPRISFFADLFYRRWHVKTYPA